MPPRPKRPKVGYGTGTPITRQEAKRVRQELGIVNGLWMTRTSTFAQELRKRFRKVPSNEWHVAVGNHISDILRARQNLIAERKAGAPKLQLQQLSQQLQVERLELASALHDLRAAYYSK